MYVVKRDGRRMPVAFDKITARVKKLSYGLDARFCDPVRRKKKKRKRRRRQPLLFFKTRSSSLPLLASPSTPCAPPPAGAPLGQPITPSTPPVACWRVAGARAGREGDKETARVLKERGAPPPPPPPPRPPPLLSLAPPSAPPLGGRWSPGQGRERARRPQGCALRAFAASGLAPWGRSLTTERVSSSSPLPPPKRATGARLAKGGRRHLLRRHDHRAGRARRRDGRRHDLDAPGLCAGEGLFASVVVRSARRRRTPPPPPRRPHAPPRLSSLHPPPK